MFVPALLAVLTGAAHAEAPAAEAPAPVTATTTAAPGDTNADPLATVPELVGARLRQDIAVTPRAGGSCEGAAAATVTVPRGDAPVLVVGDGGDARWRVGDAQGTTAGGSANLPPELPIGRNRVCVERDGAAAAVDLNVVVAPYTQISLHEVAPDGTERVRSVSLETITGETVVSRRWMNSDFLHMDRFYDGQGRALRVDVRHDAKDHHYYYDATLAEPVPPGGVLVMDDWGKAEPFSVTPVAPGELLYSFRHSPNAGAPTRRVEVYRLPEGAVVVESPELTRREREERVELVRVATIPAGGSLATRFRYQLAGAAVAEGPAVVATSPARGALDVDPATKEIRVTFDADMADGSWSWVQADGAYPKVKGNPRYVDARTCVLPVSLKPDTEYVVWVNHARYGNFRSKDGVSAAPYELRFRTAKAK